MKIASFLLLISISYALSISQGAAYESCADYGKPKSGACCKGVCR